MEKVKTIYDGVNRTVLSMVPLCSHRILDIGCGTGVLGECLRRENHQRHVVGITYSPQEAELASMRLSKVYCADLTTFDFRSLDKFDCVILSHILEHLYSPEELLERLKNVLEPRSVIVVALPNIVWWKQRLQFLIGKWRYQDWGILDRTHFRFFDRHSSAELLEGSGYEILQRKYYGPFPMGSALRISVGAGAEKADLLASRWMPGLLATQFVYLAKLKAS